MVINAVGSLFFTVFALTTSFHDVALAFMFFAFGIAGILGGFRLVPVRLLRLVVVTALAAAGIVEIESGRIGIGSICCAWAFVIAARFVLAKRHHAVTHPLE